MKTLKAILLLAILSTLVVSIQTSYKVSELNTRLDDIRDTWILATTPVSSIEEINAEDLTLQKHNYPENNYQEEVK
jgi:hypothetical protein